MAVVVTIAKGYDLGYIWKTQDHKADHATGGYYLNAAQAGEPPGRWWGPGAQALGLTPGQRVDRQPYDAVYQQTDPHTGAKLGRPRGRYPTFADHLTRLKAAEPHANAERLIELEREAAQATRQPAAYYDITISFSKSISVLHASLREHERRARLADDEPTAAYWAGRALANGDVLRIEAITRHGIMVRRMLDPDPATGQRRFTAQAFRYTGYQTADLAYAVTGHSAQGATMHTGIALVTGTEDRQWLYPAMTRGTDTNLAYVFTTPALPADPQPGTRPAPELGRYDRLRRERAGYHPDEPLPGGPDRAGQREPVAVLADVLSRDGAEQSASAIRQRNLANADHLAGLHAIWTAETQPARNDQYHELVAAALPPGHRQPVSHQARWLYRTMHAAELAGLDPADVIRTAIATRDLAGARDVAAVIDARIRPRIDPLLPSPAVFPCLQAITDKESGELVGGARLAPGDKRVRRLDSLCGRSVDAQLLSATKVTR